MLYRETVYRRRPGLPGRLPHHLERPLVDQRYCRPRDIFDRRGLRAPYIEQLSVVQPTGVLSISLDELLPYRTAITDICPPDICPRAPVPPENYYGADRLFIFTQLYFTTKCDSKKQNRNRT